MLNELGPCFHRGSPLRYFVTNIVNVFDTGQFVIEGDLTDLA
jgi:hypothetical protein